MNVRMIRNILLIGALCATAVVLPAHRAQAQSCDAACAACYQYWAQQYVGCLLAGYGENYCEVNYLDKDSECPGM
jgi:hypothetical protein